MHRLTRIKGRITAVAWDPRGEMVVIGRSDGDVFAWNLKRGEAAGQDSLDAVEEYFGASSAIVGVAFHPSGRVFFTAEIGGRLTLWRLLRTEQELGMRDKAAVIDEKQRGVHRQTFADLPVKVRDFWLDSDGVFLYAAAEDGKVYRFKVRGLKSIGELTVGKDILYSVTGLSLGSSKLLANSGRTQRLEFWCQSRDLQEDAVRSRGSLLTGMALAPDAVDDFVAQSEKLKYPPDLIRSSATGALLWATQKTGNLLTFDANFLLATPNLRNRAENCR